MFWFKLGGFSQSLSEIWLTVVEVTLFDLSVYVSSWSFAACVLICIGLVSLFWSMVRKMYELIKFTLKSIDQGQMSFDFPLTI